MARAERNQCIDWALKLAGAIKALDERTNIISLHVQRVHQSCAFRRDHFALLCKHFVCEAYMRVCIKTRTKRPTDKDRYAQADRQTKPDPRELLLNMPGVQRRSRARDASERQIYIYIQIHTVVLGPLQLFLAAHSRVVGGTSSLEDALLMSLVLHCLHHLKCQPFATGFRGL